MDTPIFLPAPQGDVDDLIFGEEFSGYREKSQPCSER